MTIFGLKGPKVNWDTSTSGKDGSRHRRQPRPRPRDRSNSGGSRPMEIDAPEAHWVEGMTLNFDRHRQLTQALLPNFLERKSGAIVSVTGNLEPEVVNTAMVAKAGLVI